MKIRALRLAHVGMFSAPTSLEGLTGQLDVLTGPNEMGKSTLFSALTHLLGTPATSKSKDISGLRNEASGAPLIEADIEIGGKLLRLRKRYLSRPSARLEDLRSGEAWIDGDAERIAEQMMGAGGRSAARSLLWVEQGASFGLPDKPDATLASALASLIEREAADAAGAGETRRVMEEVRKRLEEFVTVKTGKHRANGPLDLARKRRDELKAQLEQSRAAAEASQARTSRHRELTEERGRIASPKFTTELAERAAAARSSVEAADRARQKLQTAEERLKSAKLELKQAADALERHTQAFESAARLRRELDDARDRERSLRSQLAEQEAGLQELRAGIAAREAELADARADVQKAREHQDFQAAEAELARIAESLSVAQEATAADRDARAQLAAIRVTEAALDHLKELTSQLGMAQARALAEATVATPRYIASGVGRLRIDGRVIADGEPIRIERPTEIVIDGVGTILIEPPKSDGITAAEARDDLSRQLAMALADLGVSDVAEASAMLEHRRRLEVIRTSAAARLAAVAPNGVAALEQRHALVSQSLSGRPRGDASVDPAEARERMEALSEALASARTRLGKAEQEFASVSNELTRIVTTIESAQKQLAGFDAHLTSAEDEADRRRALTAAADSAEAGLGEAIREQGAWKEAAPSLQDYETLKAQLARAEAAIAVHRERREAIDREIAILEGALRRDGEDGAGSDVPALEEELAVAEARVADLETDVAALNLIATRLERARSSHREQILRPVVSRLDALLGRLFPEAKVAMDGPLLAVRLDRGLRSDPHGRLSGGTREQIATLVRLAYADLMAARGIELPLVLDDALVFSDDLRLEIMMELLAAAAIRHQVIVLSCHERALTPLLVALGVQPLALTPWNPEIPAAVAPVQKGRVHGPASSLLS